MFLNANNSPEKTLHMQNVNHDFVVISPESRIDKIAIFKFQYSS